MTSSGLIVDTLADQLYNKLLKIDPYTYHLIPELAQRWEILDSGARYILHLRKNVSFQKTRWFKPMRNMNANDVVFSFNRMFVRKHPYHNLNGGHYLYFDSLQFIYTVQSIHKLDNYTVEICLKQPNVSFLWHLATHHAPILSAEYANILMKENKKEKIDYLLVGTGPFMLNEYHAGQYIRLKKHDAFWKGKPCMPQVIIDLAAGGTGYLSKLLTRECDVLAYPAASQLSILRNDLRLILSPSMNIAYLVFNTQKKPLDNINVRRAIAYSINNKRLMQSIYYGTVEMATSILPRTSWAYDQKANTTEYNPEKSITLLKQAGVDNLSLQLCVPTRSQVYNSSPLKTAELIQADMAQVDIHVSIVSVQGQSQEQHLSDMNYDIILSGWVIDSNDPDNLFRPLLNCAAIDSQTNLSYWCDPSFDYLLHKSLLSQNIVQRIIYYQNAQKILAEQLPILPLVYFLHLQVYHHDIQGLILTPFGNISFADVCRKNNINRLCKLH
ncbi:Peptide transport periplasmic protein SapA [Candidatus Profftia lariciata]|nr:Peptide transport periplasmic protein SapA [Candidatus Profftia lariciata]